MTTLNVEIYNALIDANASEEKAKKAAESIISTKELATKSDISGLGNRLGCLETKVDGLEKTVDGLGERMDRVEKKLGDIGEDMASVKATLKSLIWVIGLAAAIIIGVLKFF